MRKPFPWKRTPQVERAAGGVDKHITQPVNGVGLVTGLEVSAVREAQEG